MATKKSKERRYWDACNFIAVINKEAGRVVPCAAILKEAQQADPKIEIVSSIITIAEVVKPKDCVGLTPEQEAQIDAFFENDWLIPVNCDRHIMEEARKLQRAYSVKVRDAIHIASAIFAGVSIIETYDGPLLQCNSMIPDPSGSGPVVIRQPYFAQPQQGSIFDAPTP
jgi:hypothetical protein